MKKHSDVSFGRTPLRASECRNSELRSSELPESEPRRSQQITNNNRTYLILFGILLIFRNCEISKRFRAEIADSSASRFDFSCPSA